MPGIFEFLAGPFEGIVKGIKSLIGSFVTDPNKKLEAEAATEQLLAAYQAEIEQTFRKELEAKERVIVAELQQGDNYTKRARPSVVYGGLLALFLNNILLPWLAYFTGTEAGKLPSIELPTEFWLGWSGIVATYSIGRSMEKRAQANGTEPGKIVKLITGTK